MFNFIRKLFGIPAADELDDSYYYEEVEHQVTFQEYMEYREDLEKERKRRQKDEENKGIFGAGPVMDYIIMDEIVNNDDTNIENCNSDYLDIDTSELDWSGSSDNYNYDTSECGGFDNE